MLGVLSATHPAPTLPASVVKNEAESPLLLCDSSTESTSEPSSPSSVCSVASSASYTLLPRLPITCNETALSQQHGRQQVRILNKLFIPLPITSSDDKSKADTSTKFEADSPWQNQDESPTSRPMARLIPMTKGRVTIRMLSAIPKLDSSRGVTNVLSSRLLTDEQRRSHQQGTPEDRGTHLEQPS